VKTLFMMVLVAAAVASMAGCAGNRQAVVKAGESKRHDVFQPAVESKGVADKALLKIEFPVKNFKARFINTYIKYSDPPYTVTINIDGQSVLLTDEPVLENLPGDFKENPEVGTGWKYTFRKELWLEPGKHHVTIAVPLSDVVTEKDVTLNVGENLMQLVPEYNPSVSKYPDYPRFNHGLSRVMIKLNNQKL
jgi:hypothetical protein